MDSADVYLGSIIRKGGRRYEVSRKNFIVHKKARPQEYGYDIGLLKTNPIMFTS